MSKEWILERISKGRTDLVFELLGLPDWRESHTRARSRRCSGSCITTT